MNFTEIAAHLTNAKPFYSTRLIKPRGCKARGGYDVSAGKCPPAEASRLLAAIPKALVLLLQ